MKIRNLLVIFLVALLLCGCKEEGLTPGAQVIEDENTRFVTVTLVGTDAATAQVTLVRFEEGKDRWFDGAEFPMYFDGTNRYSGTVDSEGVYYVSVTTADGKQARHILRFEDNRVCCLELDLSK